MANGLLSIASFLGAVIPTLAIAALPMPQKVADASFNRTSAGSLRGHLLFGMATDATGRELFRSDGTPTGTGLLRDIVPGTGGSFPGWMARLGDRLLFQASDPAHMYELYATDGTAGGTGLFKDLNPSGPGVPAFLVRHGSHVYFTALGPQNSPRLWRTDGTPEGTLELDWAGPGIPEGLATTSNAVYAMTSDSTIRGNNGTLWRIDPSTGTVAKVAEGLQWPALESTAALGNLLFFSSGGLVPGQQHPWVTDGTLQGTRFVMLRMDGSYPTNFTRHGDHVYLTAFDDTSGTQKLYRMNGREDGTRRIELPAGMRRPAALTSHGGYLYLSLHGPAGQSGLWRTDGTTEGFELVRAFDARGDNAEPTSMLSADGLLWMTVFVGPENRGELWLLEAPDRTPDAFTFAARTDVSRSTDTRSALVQVLGLGTSAPVTVAGGGYSIGCGSEFTSEPGWIEPGQWICVRHRTPDTALATTTTTLTIGGVSAPFTTTTAATDEAGQVAGYYDAVLRRPPDAGAIEYWVGEAERVEALGADLSEVWYAMAGSFFGSPEYQSFERNDAEFVRDLYEAFFNRTADDAGLAYWTGEIASGLPREAVLTSFLFSPEFTSRTRERFGDTAARAEVNVVMDFYRGILGRLPDDAGFTYWVGRFRTAQCQSRDAVVQAVEAISSGFTTSSEYNQRARTNGQFVSDMYNAFMRRGAERDGVSFWEFQLSAGRRDREGVRRAFMTTPEFTARVKAVMAQGCLQ